MTMEYEAGSDDDSIDKDADSDNCSGSGSGSGGDGERIAGRDACGTRGRYSRDKAGTNEVHIIETDDDTCLDFNFPPLDFIFSEDLF